MRGRSVKTSGILPRRVRVRSCKYLNNVIEQDHRRIKQPSEPMLGFKRFETVAVMIRDIPVGRENQETTVQPQTTNRKSNHHLEVGAALRPGVRETMEPVRPAGGRFLARG